ncbi:hypothetical protein Tco_0454601 [Tanacetum coccineum]
MDANKKIDLKHPLCPNESKILANILQNQPLRFSIIASSSVPWIYLGQFWHNLKEDGSKYRLKFVLDRKELTMTLDDYRTIFHLPQATDNNHDHFMITDDMKLTKNYRMYVAVFRVDVPMTQSQPIESTQGTHRTTTAPKSPNPDVDEGDSSAQRKSTVIRLCIPPRRSTRLTPPTPIPTTTKADDIILQDIIQLSLAEQKSHDELEAKQNVQYLSMHSLAIIVLDK